MNTERVCAGIHTKHTAQDHSSEAPLTTRPAPLRQRGKQAAPGGFCWEDCPTPDQWSGTWGAFGNKRLPEGIKPDKGLCAESSFLCCDPNGGPLQAVAIPGPRASPGRCPLPGPTRSGRLATRLCARLSAAWHSPGGFWKDPDTYIISRFSHFTKSGTEIQPLSI